MFKPRTTWSRSMPRKSRQRRQTEADALNALRRIVQALRVAAQRAQSGAGISAAQLYVLAQLAGGAAMSINELGERTFTDRSSVGAVVTRLVERGLVERTRAAEDRRRAEVRITAAGQEALGQAPSPPTGLLVAGLETLDDAALGALASGLRSLVAAMGLAEAPAEMLFGEEAGRVGAARRGHRP